MHVHYCVEVMGDLPGGEFICIVAIWARVTSPKMEGNLCRACVCILQNVLVHTLED